MRIELGDMLFVAMDYQEKLMPSIQNREHIVKRSLLLMKCLRELHVPMIMTTQYSKGLGHNIREIRELVGDENNFDKLTFSIYKNEHIKNYIDRQKKKFVVLAGAETHVCVLQSLIDLKAAGYVPVLVTDCSGSRDCEDRSIALKGAENEGVILTTAESLVCELYMTAAAPKFKKFLEIFKDQ